MNADVTGPNPGSECLSFPICKLQGAAGPTSRGWARLPQDGSCEVPSAVWVRTLRYHPVSDGVGGNHDLPEEEDFGQVGLQ